MSDSPAAQTQPQGFSMQWSSPLAVKVLSQRTASEDARFMLGTLRPEMQVLDCGCGAGSITLGLAAYVPHGEVRGIDLNANVIRHAQDAAVQQAVANATFEVGDVQALAFEDRSFDLVFSHALMEHLPRPLDALAEMKRVLKAGGVIALRVPDWTGNLSHPNSDNLHGRFLSHMERLFKHNGSDPYRGRQLGTMLNELGFVDIRLTASYTCYGTPEQVAELVQVVGEYVLGPSRVDVIVANGWGTADEIQQIKAELDAWARIPGAFHMRTWIEAIARKP